MKVCMSTCPPEHADALARKVVERRLAACVNVVGPVSSHYRWQGALVREEEVLLILKTSDDCAEALQAYLAEIHPYDVPEIVVIPTDGVWPPYLAWVESETARRSNP